MKVSGGTRNTKSITNVRQIISSIISDIKSKGFSTITPFVIGQIEERMEKFANKEGIKLGSSDIYMSSSSISHAIRDSKVVKQLSVSETDLQNFPTDRFVMDLYYDLESGNFTYTNGKTKYIINPNYEMKISRKKTKIVSFVTASIVNDKYEFRMRKYIKI